MDNTTFPIPTLPKGEGVLGNCGYCLYRAKTFSRDPDYVFCRECFILLKLASAIDKHIKDSNGGDSPDLELCGVYSEKCTECTMEYPVSCLSVPWKKGSFCHECAVREFCTVENYVKLNFSKKGE